MPGEVFCHPRHTAHKSLCLYRSEERRWQIVRNLKLHPIPASTPGARPLLPSETGQRENRSPSACLLICGARLIEAKHFVEYNGRPVTSVKTAFKSAVGLVGLGPGISPHPLRHTAASRLMQKGADPWQAAGYLGMLLEVLLNTYGHHHPDYLSEAVEKIAMRVDRRTKGARISGSVSGAVIPIRRNST